MHLHTHNTTGTGDMVNLMAIQAGVDIVDTALSPLGNGTSQPATEPLVATLAGTEYDTGIDMNLLTQATEHFRKVADKLTQQGILDPKVLKRRREHPEVSGARRHAVQPDQSAQAGRVSPISFTKCWRKCRGSVRTSVIPRWSPPPARSWALRP